MRRPGAGLPDEPRKQPSSPSAGEGATKSKPSKAPKPAKAPKQPKPVKQSRRARRTVTNEASTSPATASTRPTRVQRRRDSAAVEAKRALREATRARKAYERDEMRRFTAHLRRRRITVFAILGSIVALAIFVGVGVFSPLMALESVQVNGTHRVDAAAIERDLATQIGRPLPLVDTNVVRQSLAKQPLVKSYSIQSIPPHTLVVNVVERSPIAYLVTSHGYSLVDPAGVSIEVTPTKVRDFPIIGVAGGSPTSAGFPAAVSVLEALPDSVRAIITEVQAQSTDNVVLLMQGSSAKIVWGSAEQSTLKSTVLAALMRKYPPRANSVYDVSSPSSVVVR